MIKTRNQTEDFLILITKNCETFIEHTHRKAEQTLEFKIFEPRETFQFIPPVQVKENWMLGLVDWETYNSIFNIKKQNKKIEFYKFHDERVGGVSYEKVRDEIEKDLDFSNFTDIDLQDEIISPLLVKNIENKLQKYGRCWIYEYFSGLSKFCISRFRKLSQNRI